MRTGDAGAAAGCAGGSLGLSARILREAHSRANSTGSGHAPARDGRGADRTREAADPDRRRRCSLLRGVRSACAVRDTSRHSRRRDAGRQRRSALGSSTQRRRHRRDRLRRGERSSQRTRTWLSQSARACRISRPRRTRCFRIRSGASCRSTSVGTMSQRAMPLQSRAMLHARSKSSTRSSANRAPARISRSASRRFVRRGMTRSTRRRKTSARQAAERCASPRCGEPQRLVPRAQSYALRAACQASCTSCGARRIATRITWSTATPAWATRSRAAWASSSRSRSATSS